MRLVTFLPSPHSSLELTQQPTRLSTVTEAGLYPDHPNVHICVTLSLTAPQVRFNLTNSIIMKVLSALYITKLV